jgi:hypothetical protein
VDPAFEVVGIHDRDSPLEAFPREAGPQSQRFLQGSLCVIELAEMSMAGRK